MNKALDELLQQPGTWRATERSPHTSPEHAPTGSHEPDQGLPGGGWPLGALTELQHEEAGIGELRRITPTLVQLSRQGKWVALIAPPFIPYAPALTAFGVDLSRLLVIRPRDHVDALWAVEQALRAGTCGAVLAWPKQVDERALRRLQLAAEAGKTWGVLFRGQDAAGQSTPAALPALSAPSPSEPRATPIVRSARPAARPLGRPRHVRPLQRPSPQLDLPLGPRPATPPRPQPAGITTWPRR